MDLIIVAGLGAVLTAITFCSQRVREHKNARWVLSREGCFFSDLSLQYSAHRKSGLVLSTDRAKDIAPCTPAVCMVVLIGVVGEGVVEADVVGSGAVGGGVVNAGVVGDSVVDAGVVGAGVEGEGVVGPGVAASCGPAW